MTCTRLETYGKLCYDSYQDDDSPLLCSLEASKGREHWLMYVLQRRQLNPISNMTKSKRKGNAI